MEQDRKPRNKPMNYDQLIHDKGGKTIQWRKTVSSINGAGKTGQLNVKNEIRTFFSTIYKNKLKMD